MAPVKEQHRKQTTTWFDGNQEHEWCIDCVELWPCEAMEGRSEDV
ncbi:hypothetical protein SEA_MOLIVIA_15 [Arthrobacter phage Molivia]|uniref:Uncharacterized protein n=1 Tax=Arthrobacter phage Molivia TaxID=2015839 RepID=A0A286N4D7_9CAUD|nr:hypothetical protein FDI28_gp15 [Arthrobacter phage Molivia]ASX99244.1 hypothetical protein SEA_MOLIVIA_15 [Arthrobacter phage Molivia]